MANTSAKCSNCKIGLLSYRLEVSVIIQEPSSFLSSLLGTVDQSVIILKEVFPTTKFPLGDIAKYEEV